jgi:ribose/xylose/arabinose/galactoside ABC-type transport system permease subunit
MSSTTSTPTTSPTAPAPPTSRQPLTDRLKDVSLWAEWAALVGLIVLVIIFQIANSTFLSFGNVQAMLVAGAILIILAIGQSYVVLTAGIDLSIASTLTFSAVAFGQIFSRTDGNLLLSCLAAIAAGGIVGTINGLLVSKGKITDFIVTLGTLSAASGAALIFADGKPVTVINITLLKLSTGGVGIFGWTFIIAIAIAVIAHVVLFWTRFGTHVLATGGSPEAANATGISTARIKLAVYMISGLLAGFASILLVARIGAAEPAANTAFLLNSVASVVLGGVSLFGGRGSITGPVIGALLLTVLVNGLTLVGVSQFYQPLSVGVVVVLAAFLTRFQK